MKFFNTLAGFANIDQETYRCELIVIIHSHYSLPDLKGLLGKGSPKRARKGLCLLIVTCPKMQLTLIYLPQGGN